MFNGEYVIFSLNRSFLLRKSMMAVFSNHLLLQIDWNNTMLSCIRFCRKITVLDNSIMSGIIKHEQAKLKLKWSMQSANIISSYSENLTCNLTTTEHSQH